MMRKYYIIFGRDRRTEKIEWGTSNILRYNSLECFGIYVEPQFLDSESSLNLKQNKYRESSESE